MQDKNKSFFISYIFYIFFWDSSKEWQNFCDIQWLSSCRISATTCDWVITEFLQHPVVEWLQNFCDNLWVRVAEFLQQLVTEWSQNFCNIQWLSGPRISATTCDWVIAEFLQHPVLEWSQNFCNSLWLGDRRISVASSGWVVVEFLQQHGTEWLQNFCDI